MAKYIALLASLPSGLKKTAITSTHAEHSQ